MAQPAGSDAGPSSAKKRKMSQTEQNQIFDKIVTSQFDDNMELLRKKLEHKKGLLTFLIGLIDSGKLEEAYDRAHQDTGEVRPATFAQGYKYMKQAGSIWIRDFLGQMNPTYKIPDGLTEAEKKARRLSLPDYIHRMCLALRIHPDCWLFHMQQETTTQTAVQRCRNLNNPIETVSPTDSLDKKGFYTASDDNAKVLALGMGPLPQEQHERNGSPYMWVPPPSAEDVEWKFKDNWNSQATIMHPNGDAFQLKTRFQSKYPVLFTEAACTLAMSIEADGESPHPSLGDVRRASVGGKGKRGKGKGVSKGAAPAAPAPPAAPAAAPAAPPVPPPGGAGGGAAAAPPAEEEDDE